MTKEEARNHVRQQMKALSPEAVKERSRAVMEAVCRLSQFKTAKNIYTYVSHRQEVDTIEFIARCLSEEKNVFVPKVSQQMMRFHRIDGLAELKKGSYGILEPQNSYCSEWDAVSGLMIMPGLAFDAMRNRAGYGGGFYDRFLTVHSGLFCVAVCFDFQIVDRIETQEFDVKPQLIISESGIIGQKGFT